MSQEMSKNHLGMWLFLASEVLIFGVLIYLFEIFYQQHPAAFEAGSHELHFYHGTVNTVVLLTSSYFVALAQMTHKRTYILLAIILGLVFLGIKGTEYYDLIQEGKFVWDFAPSIPSDKKIFFIFYAFMSMLHAVHVIFGIVAMMIVWWQMKNQPDEEVQENVGLYWHLVDMVWVFLYPLFYLLGH